MCGIHAVISAFYPGEIPSILKQCLCNRGPDYISTHRIRVDVFRQGTTASTHLALTSTVLGLRGDQIAKQPFVDPQNGSALCWNGEAWKIKHHDVTGNDGEVIARLLFDATGRSLADREDAILNVLRSIDGPFAFVFFDASSNKLYFGRDRLGRRSLLVRDDGDMVILSSVAETVDPSWREVEADGVYVLDLAHEDGFTSANRRDWLEGEEYASFVSAIDIFNDAHPGEEAPALTSSSHSVAQLRDRLTESLMLRVLDVPPPPGCIEQQTQIRIAVLFSGGLDCTVMARLCHDLLPAEQGIDLLNIAFENPRVAANAKKVQGKNLSDSFDIYEACPDRITGRKSFSELQAVCPERGWRLVAVNVPYSEYSENKKEVTSLIYPHNTEMDLSIASALYFAARGQGLAFADSTLDVSIPYTTPARVLLSGLGADELFGGYSRHPAAFQRGGYSGLIEELKLDVSRLGKRNLGRDDRAMSHWGREVRFPFLDEDLVKWAVRIPVWEKCDFGKPDGEVEPGKRVLRLLAVKLGMAGVATEKKRAIQFGSRTAKMESGKVKGTTLLS